MHRPDDVAGIGERRCRRTKRAGYPRSVTSSTRAPRRPRGSAGPAPTGSHANGDHVGWDPDGGHGEIHDLRVAAVAEAARLLDADGAMVYLVDPAPGHLRFAHDAGIKSRRRRAWVRSLDLPVGV